MHDIHEIYVLKIIREYYSRISEMSTRSCEISLNEKHSKYRETKFVEKLPRARSIVSVDCYPACALDCCQIQLSYMFDRVSR